jgi:hypothetical protein
MIKTTKTGEPLLEIAIGASRKETKWVNTEMTWAELTKRLSKTRRTAETVDAYLKADKTRQDEIKDIGGFVGGPVIGGKRRKGAVLSRWVLTLDIDRGRQGVWETLELLYDCSACVYSTHTHTPLKPRLRIVMPLSRAVGPDEYQAIARLVASDLGMDMFDRTTFEPERLMYWPSTPSDGEFYFREQMGVEAGAGVAIGGGGGGLNVDEMLCRYGDCEQVGKEAWRDISLWPTGEGEIVAVDRELRRQRDPTEKDGVIGAFCRVYSISEAIGEFLSDLYTPVDSVGADGAGISNSRWTYLRGSTVGGALVYQDKWLYSHHSTDPVCGTLCNAFDLVRIHLFGDKGTKGSMQAMLTFIMDDKTVSGLRSAELVGMAKSVFEDEFSPRSEKERTKKDTLRKEDVLINDEGVKGVGGGANIGGGRGRGGGVGVETGLSAGMGADGVAMVGAGVGPMYSVEQGDRPNPDWAKELELDKKGNILGDIPNILRILRNHPDMFAKVKLNEFDGFINVMGDLPWREMGRDRTERGGRGYREWTDGDLAGFKGFLQAMGMKSVGHAADAIEAWVGMGRGKWHPVRAWLSSLKWDGVERIERLFIDYLGAADTAYVREVSRKWLLAAVARVMNPGCKFDQMLVLSGPAGRGKSTILRLLAGGYSGNGDWFSDSLVDMHSKDSMDALRGVWILEVGELTSLKRSDVESVWRFISSVEDKYRPAYGRYTVKMPRQCVMAGTTNTSQFMPPEGGARRFWPISIGTRGENGKDWGKGSQWDITAEGFWGRKGVVGQLWAEAVCRYEDGEKYWELSEEAGKGYQGVVEEHTESDIWQDWIAFYLSIDRPEAWSEWSPYERRNFVREVMGRKSDSLADKGNTEDGGEAKTYQISIPEIWVECMGKERENMQRFDSIRIGKILQVLGWKNAGLTHVFQGYGRCKCYRK